MVAACTVLLLGAVASVAPPLPSGARVILTQRILDAVRDAALPVALDFLRTYPIPDFETDKDSFRITASNVQLADLDASAAITLRAPGTLQLHLSNLRLGISAHVRAREDHWPHPSASGTVSGNADGSSASVALSVKLTTGVPSVVVDSCVANILVSHLRFHGLGLLDHIIDWVAGFFKGHIRDMIASEVGRRDRVVEQDEKQMRDMRNRKCIRCDIRSFILLDKATHAPWHTLSLTD